MKPNKAMNTPITSAQRLVAFNPWELNSPTEFQDFFTGEGFEDPRGYNELLHAARELVK